MIDLKQKKNVIRLLLQIQNTTIIIFITMMFLLKRLIFYLRMIQNGLFI